jgi:hypothetical protein
MAHQQNPPEHWNSYRPTYEPRLQQGPQSAGELRMDTAGEYCNPNKILLVAREQRTEKKHPQSPRNLPSGDDEHHKCCPPHSALSSSASSFRPKRDTFIHAASLPIYVSNTRLSNDDVFPHYTPFPTSYLNGRETEPEHLRRCGISTDTFGSSSEGPSILPDAVTTLMGRASRAYDLVINYARDCPLGTRWSAASIKRVRKAGLHLHDDIRVLRHWQREAGRMDGDDWDVLEQDGAKVEKLSKYVLGVISETEDVSGLRGWREGSESEMVIDLGYGGVTAECGMGGGQPEVQDVGSGGRVEDGGGRFPRYQGKYEEREGGGETDTGRAVYGRGDGQVAGTLGRHVLWR